MSNRAIGITDIDGTMAKHLKDKTTYTEIPQCLEHGNYWCRRRRLNMHHFLGSLLHSQIFKNISV
jgi:hypothetical protein